MTRTKFYALALQDDASETLGMIDGATGDAQYVTGEYVNLDNFVRYALGPVARRNVAHKRFNVYRNDMGHFADHCVTFGGDQS